MKKLFSFDLDGTLLNNEGSIFIENIEAIEKASKKGHKIAIATGRNYIYAQLATKQYWGLFDYFVGCNGGIMHSIRERKIYLEEEKISFDFVPSIIEEIKEVGGTIQISTDKDVFVEMYIYEH
ncbi:MAG: HAD hydrolase family protein, partial [Mycoplasmataceae bacterium]|nr:HAD hydrolase family protein [Mycoplasmataceae bacterium]